MKKRISFFISSHGFGHASRESAIMAKLNQLDHDLDIDIYSETPEWFFKDSGVHFDHYFNSHTDVGMIQKTPLEIDFQATINNVENFINTLPEESNAIAHLLNRNGTNLVIADISPLGILSAKKAGIPCILFENFTWDWIYAKCTNDFPSFAKINQELKKIFILPDYRCQLIPECFEVQSRNLIIDPIYRDYRNDRNTIRERLGIPSCNKMGLISMGGIPQNYDIHQLSSFIDTNVSLVIPGNFEKAIFSDTITILPHHSDFYHPDLVHAADFMIGKTGYSTIAEVRSAGIPFAYISRKNFRESEVTASYLQNFSNTIEISQENFDKYQLQDAIEFLTSSKNIEKQISNGSISASKFIIEKLQLAL